MKIITILFLVLLFTSCEKEKFEPKNIQQKKNYDFHDKLNKIEIFYLFFDEKDFSSGYANFYSGQNLNYVYEFTQLDLKDTILNDDVEAKFIKFTRYIDNLEIIQNDGYFFVNTHFNRNITALNLILVNNVTALNGHHLFPEPAVIFAQNKDLIVNFFRIKITKKTNSIENLSKY